MNNAATAAANTTTRVITIPKLAFFAKQPSHKNLILDFLTFNKQKFAHWKDKRRRQGDDNTSSIFFKQEGSVCETQMPPKAKLSRELVRHYAKSTQLKGQKAAV